MTTDSSQPSTGARYSSYALLALVILAGGLLRFHGIDERGLLASDAVLYTHIAKEWSDGNFVYGVSEQIQYYRPTAFLLFALSFKTFGVHDYAIKLLNSFLDLINLYLVFRILLLLSGRDRWVALGGATVYATLPIAVRIARSEFVHTVSCLTVLLSLLFFVHARQAADRRKQRLFLLLCGAAVAAATLTHEELIFVGFGYALYLAIRRLPGLRRPGGLTALSVDGLLLTLPMLAGALKLATAYGLTRIFSGYGPSVVASMAAQGAAVKEQTSTLLFYLQKSIRLTWNAIITHTSALSLLLFLLAASTLIFWAVRGRLQSDRRPIETPPLNLLPAFLVLFYSFAYSIFFGFYVTRLFLPLTPFVIITIFLWQRRLLARAAPIVAATIPLLSAVVLAIFHLESYEHMPTYTRAGFYQSWHPVRFSDLTFRDSIRAFQSTTYFKLWPRQVYDELEGKVSGEAKLLVTSALLHPMPGRRVFQSEVYFGDDAVYVIDHREPLDELISKHKIRYVLFTALATEDRRLMEGYASRYLYDGRWEHGVELVLGESYGFAPGEYTIEKEYHYLADYLAARDATLVAIKRRPKSAGHGLFNNLQWVIFDLG